MTVALASGTARAEQEAEVGGFLGVHIFSQDNELGVADIEEALSPSNSFTLGLRFSWAVHPMFAIEAEGGFIPGKIRDSETTEVLALTFRLQGLVHFGDVKAKFRPFGLLGAGGMYGNPSDDGIQEDTDFVFHGGGGLKYRVGDSWGFRGDVRLLLPPSSSSESVTVDFEALAGLYYAFPNGKEEPPPPKDSDGDGLNDDVDKCASEAEDKDGFQDDDGCPDADNDADGISDDSDQCAGDPEDQDGFEDEDGCPDPDNDSDGVPDTDDKCASEAEDKDGHQDEDGCPDPDNDGDGIDDGTDQCVNEAEDKDSHQDEDGCPDPDNDGDGVNDEDDKCPTDLETKNGYEDDDGCPDTIPNRVKRFTGVIRGITFEVNKTAIRRTSYRTLNLAIRVLQEYPKLRVEISGHTDNRGNTDHNRELSLQRAQAVKDYMVGKGIEEARLEVKGYGPDQPIATNKTNRGRARNRRVEFKLLSNLIQGIEDPPEDAATGETGETGENTEGQD